MAGGHGDGKGMHCPMDVRVAERQVVQGLEVDRDRGRRERQKREALRRATLEEKTGSEVKGCEGHV